MSSILVIDSGLGGVSILNAIHEKLPAEEYIYFSDFSCLPYGEKSADFLNQRLKAIVDYFVEKEMLKAVVLACNTATVASISFLRQCYDFPIFGIEPGIKPAAKQARKGIVVFATKGTLNSDQFNRLVSLYADGKPVYSKAVPEWVELVENSVDPAEVANQLEKDLSDLPEGFDTVLLGCTHFSFLAKHLSSLLPKDVEIIDTSDAVANWIQEKMEAEGLLAPESSDECKIKLFVSSTETDASNLDRIRSNLSPSFHVFSQSSVKI